MILQSQGRKSGNTNAVVRKRQSTLSFSIKNKKRKTEEDSVKSSYEGKMQRQDELCTICDKEDPPGHAEIGKWIDCDVCHSWCHLSLCKAKRFWMETHQAKKLGLPVTLKNKLLIKAECF